MDADMSPEMAHQVLEMLTGGGSMDNINTSLALRLIPLAQDLGKEELIERLLEHATKVARNEEERGWARFEALKVMEAGLDSFVRLAEEAESIEQAQALTAAVHHYVALLYLAEARLDEARATAQHALRVRQTANDKQGLAYGMALLMTIAKRQHDEDTAIAVGTERLELLMALNDHEGQMEALADIARTAKLRLAKSVPLGTSSTSLWTLPNNLRACRGSWWRDGAWPTSPKLNRITKQRCWFFRTAFTNSSRSTLPHRRPFASESRI